MSNFNNLYKSILTEAKKEIVWKTPGKSAQFDLGAIVVTPTDLKKMPGYTNESYKHLGKLGVIEKYRVVGAGSMYLVKFEDGTEAQYRGSHLVGPFKTIEDAKAAEGKTFADAVKCLKYEDVNLEDTAKVEAEIREIVTSYPYNFTWLDTPKTDSGNEYVTTFLADRKIRFPNIMPNVNTTEYQGMPNMFTLVRFNSRKTGKVTAYRMGFPYLTNKYHPEGVLSMIHSSRTKFVKEISKAFYMNEFEMYNKKEDDLKEFTDAGIDDEDTNSIIDMM